MRSDTTPAAVRDMTTVWQATQTRIDTLLDDRPDAVLDVPVTTVPGATVRDVLVHLIDTASTAAHVSPPRKCRSWYWDMLRMQRFCCGLSKVAR